MSEHHQTFGKGFIALAAAGASWFADTSSWLDPIIRGITFYGGAVVVVLTAISFCLDIRRKWIARHHTRKTD